MRIVKQTNKLALACKRQMIISMLAWGSGNGASFQAVEAPATYITQPFKILQNVLLTENKYSSLALTGRTRMKWSRDDVLTSDLNAGTWGLWHEL
jgi:hypothetical protein